MLELSKFVCRYLVNNNAPFQLLQFVKETHTAQCRGCTLSEIKEFFHCESLNQAMLCSQSPNFHINGSLLLEQRGIDYHFKIASNKSSSLYNPSDGVEYEEKRNYTFNRIIWTSPARLAAARGGDNIPSRPISGYRDKFTERPNYS